MTEPTLFFSQVEYDLRIAKTRTSMQAQGLDLLIVSDPANMAWLTGYDGWSFYVHQCVVLSLDGQPMWFGRGIDAAGARLRTYLNDDNIIAYPDNYVQSDERHPMDYLASIVESRGWNKGKIGVELDNYWFSAAAYLSLQEHLPKAKLRNAKALVNWQRAVKSETELEYMRKAARIVERMHSRILDKADVGVRKCDLVADIYDASLRYDPETDIGGDYAAIVPLLPSGKDAAASHLTWDENPLKAGEGTFFEIAGVYRRYHCPLSRTLFLGKPSPTFLDAEKAVLEGLEAGLSVAKVGNTCEDIANSFFAVLKKYGIVKDNRTGYSIGMAYPPDWGEHTMSLRPGDTTELKENMVFHFMPGLWGDDWGFEITESIVIGKNGPECLADVPRKLFVKD